MPELPEVETTKNALAKGIGCCRILDVCVFENRLRIAIPDDFKQQILQTSILSYSRIAKYIVIKLNNNLDIICHLGMSGKFKLSYQNPPYREKHDHVFIITENGTLIFNDPRRFGLLTYIENSQLYNSSLFAKLGLDPFSDELTSEYLLNKLKNKSIPIKIALLDQSIIAGIGNIYASEILFDARISPLRNACNISLQECQILIESSRKILQKAIDAGGSTLRDYHKPDGSEGYFQFMHCVYNKTGQPCTNCSCHINETGGIQKIVQAGRSSFYCATKQK